MEIAILSLCVANFLSLLVIVFLFKRFERSVPILVQDVLNDVGAQLEETFANPTIKKAYTILGKQGGQAKADTALRERVADRVVGQSPVISKILDWLGISPLEGLQLMNDPMFGPMIQNFLAGQAKGTPFAAGGYGHSKRDKKKMEMKYG